MRNFVLEDGQCQGRPISLYSVLRMGVPQDASVDISEFLKQSGRMQEEWLQRGTVCMGISFSRVVSILLSPLLLTISSFLPGDAKLSGVCCHIVGVTLIPSLSLL